jgi:hypothetical protein
MLYHKTVNFSVLDNAEKSLGSVRLFSFFFYLLCHREYFFPTGLFFVFYAFFGQSLAIFSDLFIIFFAAFFLAEKK